MYTCTHMDSKLFHKFQVLKFYSLFIDMFINITQIEYLFLFTRISGFTTYGNSLTSIILFVFRRSWIGSETKCECAIADLLLLKWADFGTVLTIALFAFKVSPQNFMFCFKRFFILELWESPYSILFYFHLFVFHIDIHN